MTKTVKKPWGEEIWLAYPPNFPYVMKKIYTNAPHRSSLHVHDKKTETNYVLKGSGKVYIGSDAHDMMVIDIEVGSIFHIKPGMIHRIVALADLMTIEVSTPEVDDVRRLQDDTERGNGRIESEHGV
jgi:quercetin dioxygenase-like cupin family protein